jgi:hypothetical protein
VTVTYLILERSFDPPRPVAEALTRIRESGWCFAMHKVDWKESFLATDGRAMVCWFSAPDQESVRIALRQTGADTRNLWPGTMHQGREPGVPNVLVERSFVQPVPLAELQSLDAAGCLQAQGVRFVRTFLSLDRMRMLCLYEAPDAESVRLSQRKAAIPIDSVWAFQRIDRHTLPV